MKLVLDTNVVLDLLFWRDPRCDALAAALAAGRVRCFTDAACLAELERVLAYPQFALDAAAQRELLERYRRFVEFIESVEPVESDERAGHEEPPEHTEPTGHAASAVSTASPDTIPASGEAAETDQIIEAIELPRCRDADDQKFMELAARCAADLLLTRDRELLRLARSRRRPPPFAILVPEEAAVRLAATTATAGSGQTESGRSA